MKIHVEYTGQLRAAMRRAGESLELPNGGGWKALFAAIAERHRGEAMNPPAGEDGEPEGMLCFLGDEQVDWTEPPVLSDGASVTIMSAISGG